jgi:hypothetical protein
MDTHPWVVVVVRAWSENGRLRARLIRAGSAGDADVAVAGSATDAARLLHDWLQNLSPPDNPSPPDNLSGRPDAGGAADQAADDDPQPG